MKKIALYFAFLILISSCKKKKEIPVSDFADKIAGTYQIKTVIKYERGGKIINSENTTTNETITLTKITSKTIDISGDYSGKSVIKDVNISSSNGNYTFEADYTISVYNPESVTGSVSGKNLTFSVIPKNDYRYTIYKAIKF